MISNSLDVDFIHGNIHGRSCKKFVSSMAHTVSFITGMERKMIKRHVKMRGVLIMSTLFQMYCAWLCQTNVTI